MSLKVKLAVVAIVAGVALLSVSNNKPSESESLRLQQLQSCGMNIDELDDAAKEELLNMTDAQLYHVCEISLTTQEILRQQEDLINTLNSITIK